MILIRSLFLFLVLVGTPAQAYNALENNLITPNTIRTEGPFRLIRSEEDYRYFKTHAPTDNLDKIKMISLSDDQSTYLTLGGEVREKYENFANENWGKLPQTDSHLFHRLMLSADTHFGDDTRVFLEFQSALSSFGNYDLKPIDHDDLGVNQFFIDHKFHLASQEVLTLRLGRQELDYGSERLIAVREGPNARQGFDGVKTVLNFGTKRLDAFWVLPVQTKPGTFDNQTSFTQQLWALYFTDNASDSPTDRFGFDLYYIGNRKDAAVYSLASGYEVRHSVGARFYRPPQDAFDFDVEGVEQLGQLSNRFIEAWTLASDFGYSFPQLEWKPRTGLKIAAASGDHGDGAMGTFNPLYPRGAYLDLSTLIGPSNFVSLNPYLNLHPTQKISLTSGINFLWRESTNDGIYNPGMGLVRAAGSAHQAYTGSELSVSSNYQVTKNVNVLVGYAHLYAGDFIKASGPSFGANYYAFYSYFVF